MEFKIAGAGRWARRSILAGAAALGLGAMAPAHAVPVALELSLVIDVSGSVDTTEYNTQINGYKNAFLDPTVQANILSFAGSGGIAANVIMFASDATEVIAFTQLTTAAQITAFANAIGAIVRPTTIGGLTDIADGMALGLSTLASNGFDGARRVIDVSGDGDQNTGTGCVNAATCAALVQDQRNAAKTAGVTVNGLAITTDIANLDDYFNNNVKTSDGFVVVANTFAAFEPAVISKIGREITGEVPEPMTLALFGAALAGLGFAGRRKAA